MKTLFLILALVLSFSTFADPHDPGNFIDSLQKLKRLEFYCTIEDHGGGCSSAAERLRGSVEDYTITVTNLSLTPLQPVTFDMELSITVQFEMDKSIAPGFDGEEDRCEGLENCINLDQGVNELSVVLKENTTGVPYTITETVKLNTKINWDY